MMYIGYENSIMMKNRKKKIPQKQKLLKIKKKFTAELVINPHLATEKQFDPISFVALLRCSTAA